MLEKGIISSNIIAESFVEDIFAYSFYTGLYGFLKEKHPNLRDLLGEEPELPKEMQDAKQALLNRADYSGNYFVYCEGAGNLNALAIYDGGDAYCYFIDDTVECRFTRLQNGLYTIEEKCKKFSSSTKEQRYLGRKKNNNYVARGQNNEEDPARFEWELEKVEGQELFRIRLPRWKEDKEIYWQGSKGNYLRVKEKDENSKEQQWKLSKEKLKV